MFNYILNAPLWMQIVLLVVLVFIALWIYGEKQIRQGRTR